MRILEVNKFHYLRRGAERHMLDVVALLRKHGHEVGVFSMRHTENIPAPFEKYFPSFVGYDASDATVWERLKGAGRLFWSFEARRKMESLLEEWRPDIAHLHNIYHQLSPSILAPIRKRGIPIVMTVHDYNLVSPDKDAYYPEVGKRYWKFLFIGKYGIFKRLLLILKMYWENTLGFYRKNIDIYIAPSSYVRTILVRGGIPQEKIVVVPHFILGDRKGVSADDTGKGLKTPYALYFGNLSDEKGTNALADVFDSSGIPLVLAGTKADGFVLRESPHIDFVGQQSKEGLDRLIRGAACVVSASRLPETFGLIALEAVASGKPFFGLETGAYSEIIRNGENGVLASDTRTLQQDIADFFAGKYTFSSQAILGDAYERFGEEKYLRDLRALFSRLAEKTKRLR